MDNDNTNILELTHLNTFDLDKKKTTITLKDNNKGTKDIDIHTFINLRTRVCKYCGSSSLIIHDTIIKKIHHPVMINYIITIYYHQRKFHCKDCEKTSMQYNPFTQTFENLTTLGEISLLEELRNPRKTFNDLAKEHDIPSSTIIKSFDQHVDIGRHTLTSVICIDENYSKKLTRTKYSLTIYDPHSNTILDILDNRLKNNLNDYLSRIPLKERLNVKYVCIDMYSTYFEVAKQAFPNCVIAVDSFHVIEHINEAMRKARINVQKKFFAEKDINKSSNYWLLKCFNYYFVEDFNRIKYTCRTNSRFSYLSDKYKVLDTLLKIDDKLTKAYKLKEDYREFNLCRTYEEAVNQIDDFINRFKQSDFDEFKEIGNMIKRWKNEILNSFLIINHKRLSNGPIESLNGRIDRIKADGYGYSNFNRFRNRVMFSLNNNENLKNF